MSEMNSTLPEEEGVTVIMLPEALANLRSGEWLRLETGDELTEHIAQTYWQEQSLPAGWEVARLSGAVYLYREISSRWTLVTKYYQAKSRHSAQAYAQRELERIEEAGGYALLGNVARRTIRGLGTWRGVLFLEHLPGLTLADVIAARVSLPGQLAAGLKSVAQLLSTLHREAQQVGTAPDFDTALRDNRRYVKGLQKHGVLKGEEMIVFGLNDLFDKWGLDAGMRDYTPTRIHGDATTTNFVLPEEGRVVAIDWERMKTADPAADMGRLAAELAHSMRKHGADSEEAQAHVEACLQAYFECNGTTPGEEIFRKRARFYEGASLLRIARNGWIPRLERMTMVAHAMAILGG
jgi:hypothetical protein